jgi:uncharacterized protein (DUF2252 family)
MAADLTGPPCATTSVSSWSGSSWSMWPARWSVVGSVGSRAYIVLLQGRDHHDPLFLQVKEATASVLEDHLPASRYRHHGQRVVAGQRMMQAVSDIFLGWTKGEDRSRHYYWRQLRDMQAQRPATTVIRCRL